MTGSSFDFPFLRNTPSFSFCRSGRVCLSSGRVGTEEMCSAAGWTCFSACFLSALLGLVTPAAGEMVPWINDSLTGQMFSVMSSAEVRFRFDGSSEAAGLTVCMRVLTAGSCNLQLKFGNTNYIYFSGPGPSVPKYFLQVKGDSAVFETSSMTPGFPELWPWKNRCLTWSSSSGMAQMWIDGKMSVRKGVARGQVLSGSGELLLANFEGQLTDVYVWDSALPLQGLAMFLRDRTAPLGSILNWGETSFITKGYTVLEPISLTAYYE